VRPEDAAAKAKFERLAGFDLCSAAVEEASGENGGEEGEEKAENDENDTDEAELEEKAERLVLNDFFGASDTGDGRIEVERSASATEASAD